MTDRAEGSHDAARRLAVACGLSVALLFAVANAIWALGMPHGGTPAAEVVAFYEDRALRIVVGAHLSLLSLAIFLPFAAAVRTLAAAYDETLATTAFGGALLMAAAGLGAESVNTVGGLRALDGRIDPVVAVPVHEVSQVYGSVATGVGLGVFAVATAAVALRSGRLLPRGPAIAIAALGLLVLTPLAHYNVLSGAVLVAITATVAIALLREPVELGKAQR